MSDERNLGPYVRSDIEQRVNRVLGEKPGCEGWRFWWKTSGGGSRWLTDPQGQHYPVDPKTVLDWDDMSPERLAKAIVSIVKDLQG